MKPRQQDQKIAIPAELESRVRQAPRTEPEAPRRRTGWPRSACTAAVSLGVLFVALVNLNPAFAAATDTQPGIAAIARLVTIRDTVETNGRDQVSIRLPALTHTGNIELENRINHQIREKMTRFVAEARQQTAEYRRAQLATGGSPDDVIPVLIHIDSQLKYASEKCISFVVSKTRTLANAYTEQLFYNLSLPDGRELTLSELLGPDYLHRVNAEIRRQIAQRIQVPGAVYFAPGEPDGFQTISPQQSFFLNATGQVVIVFGKYEIAPGSMGIQEFAIPQPGLDASRNQTP